MLHRTRLHECLRLVATVPGHELDAVARLVRLGGRIIRGMFGWTVRQLHAVRSLVKHGHFAPLPVHPFAAAIAELVSRAPLPFRNGDAVCWYHPPIAPSPMPCRNTLDIGELCNTPFGIAYDDASGFPMPQWVNDCRTL